MKSALRKVFKQGSQADHLQMAQVCENQGVGFQPMVVESTGAWSTSVSHTLRLLARATAAREGKDAASCYSYRQNYGNEKKVRRRS